jgi:hypothetical protein
MMSEKLRAAAQAALDAMKLARGDHGTVMLAYPAIESWLYHRVDQRLDDAIKAVEDALAEQTVKESLTVAEPVACVGTNGDLMWLKKPEVIYSKPQPLYTAPPRREWVGLTGDEIEDINKDQTLWEIIRAAEAKLREKNHE